MNEPILPKSWYGAIVIVHFADAEPAAVASTLLDANERGILVGEAGAGTRYFYPWRQIARVEGA